MQRISIIQVQPSSSGSSRCFKRYDQTERIQSTLSECVGWFLCWNNNASSNINRISGFIILPDDQPFLLSQRKCVGLTKRVDHLVK